MTFPGIKSDLDDPNSDVLQVSNLFGADLHACENNVINVIVPDGVSLTFDINIQGHNVNIDVHNGNLIFHPNCFLMAIKNLNIYAENSNVIDANMEMNDSRDGRMGQCNIFSENSQLTFPSWTDLHLSGKENIILDRGSAPNVNIRNIGGTIDFDAAITRDLNVIFHTHNNNTQT